MKLSGADRLGRRDQWETASGLPLEQLHLLRRKEGAGVDGHGAGSGEV